MARLGAIAAKVRSKNAGPFCLTIDIFCGSDAAYDRISTGLSVQRVASALGAAPEVLKRFDIPSLNVVKISLPRPAVQGSVEDRDLHGASWAVLVAELDI